jgi:hypothetical protein
MAFDLHAVEPGDLIRAEFFNAIVTALEKLDDRVTVLEGETPPETGELSIDGVTPRTVRMGESLTVSGRHFGWSTGATLVFLGERLITTFTRGSETELVFTVPDIAGVPATGLPVQLAVSNATDTETTTINLLPRSQAPEGDIAVTYVGTTPATPAANALFTIEYEIASHASAVELTLTPVISTGWAPVRLLSGPTRQPVPGNRLALDRLENVNVYVEVSVPAGAAVGTPFSVELRGVAGGVLVTPSSRSFNVGTAAPQEDESIDISAPDGNALSVARGETHLYEVSCTFEDVGVYIVTTRFTPAAGGWTVDMSDVPAELPITDTTGTGGTEEFTIGITAPTALPAAQPVTLLLDVRETGRSLSRTHPVTLTAT